MSTYIYIYIYVMEKTRQSVAVFADFILLLNWSLCRIYSQADKAIFEMAEFR